VLIPEYTKGTKRKANKVYEKLMHRASYLARTGRKEEARAVRKQAQKLSSIDPYDPEYRRLRYCRYADDFLLGFVGPKEEAEEIKRRLRIFLQEELKLELSEAKTLITHARTETARFLNYAHPYHPGRLATGSARPAQPQWNDWITSPGGSHQNEVSTLQPPQSKSASPHGTHQ
jgi:hypothetical protein